MKLATACWTHALLPKAAFKHVIVVARNGPDSRASHKEEAGNICNNLSES
jgi:hypothetical protein